VQLLRRKIDVPEPAKLSWTEADLRNLLGHPETIRREYKSGKLLEEPQNSWISKLSCEVSAFANTEGGDLFLGIAEDKKSKPKVAIDIDGVPAALAPERLKDLIEGHLSPYLTGIGIDRVRLSEHPERVVFVIHIPQGTTAYQADDGCYYGRSEFGIKFLPDHETRLRMSRGKVARSTVRARLLQITPGEQEDKRRHAEAPIAIGCALEEVHPPPIPERVNKA
jgi:predicted HTH transcriptional regulator